MTWKAWTVLTILLAMTCTIPCQAMTVAQARTTIVDESIKYLNVPYLWGGNHPKTGLDCSGFVRYAYAKAGLTMARSAAMIFKTTAYLAPADVREGDLVFFAMSAPGTLRVSHIGIYMGKGYFIHASTTNGIHVNHLEDPYYLKRLIGIRRHRNL